MRPLTLLERCKVVVKRLRWTDVSETAATQVFTHNCLLPVSVLKKKGGFAWGNSESPIAKGPDGKGIVDALPPDGRPYRALCTILPVITPRLGRYVDK